MYRLCWPRFNKPGSRAYLGEGSGAGKARKKRRNERYGRSVGSDGQHLVENALRHAEPKHHDAVHHLLRKGVIGNHDSPGVHDARLDPNHT